MHEMRKEVRRQIQHLVCRNQDAALVLAERRSGLQAFDRRGELLWARADKREAAGPLVSADCLYAPPSRRLLTPKSSGNNG